MPGHTKIEGVSYLMCSWCPDPARFWPPSSALRHIILKRRTKNEYTPTPWTVKQPPPCPPDQKPGGSTSRRRRGGQTGGPTTGLRGRSPSRRLPRRLGVMDTVWPPRLSTSGRAALRVTAASRALPRGPTDALPRTPKPWAAQGGRGATCSRGPLWHFPRGPAAKTPRSSMPGPGSIPGQGTKFLQATTKTWCSQIDFFFLFFFKKVTHNPEAPEGSKET